MCSGNLRLCYGLTWLSSPVEGLLGKLIPEGGRRRSEFGQLELSLN